MTYGAPQQPGQQPAPYGAAPQPYGYAPQPYPVSAPTNTMAIVALVGSFFIPLVGIICGHISLNQIKKTGEQGKGLAIAGLVIGYIYTAFIVLYLIFMFVMLVVLGGIASSVPSSTY